jgi:hypothetical protein
MMGLGLKFELMGLSGTQNFFISNFQMNKILFYLQIPSLSWLFIKSNLSTFSGYRCERVLRNLKGAHKIKVSIFISYICRLFWRVNLLVSKYKSKKIFRLMYAIEITVLEKILWNCFFEHLNCILKNSFISFYTRIKLWESDRISFIYKIFSSFLYFKIFYL